MTYTELTQKRIRATQLIIQGVTLDVLQSTLKEEFGSGVSTNMIAKIRRTLLILPTPPKGLEWKYVRTRWLLEEGATVEQMQETLREEFGSGISGDVIAPIRRAGAKEDPEAPEVRAPSVEAAVQVLEVADPDLPASPQQTVMNGGATLFLRLHEWMEGSDVEEVHIKRNGDVEVLARHKFNLGDSR